MIAISMISTVIRVRMRWVSWVVLGGLLFAFVTGCSLFSANPRFEEIHDFSGIGATVTELFWLESGAVIFTLEHTGEHNFIVWLEDDAADPIELLANEIGAFSGSTSVHIDAAGWYMLDVEARGDWSIRAEQLAD